MGLSFASLDSAPASDLLAWAIATYGRRFAVVTSFQLEGMVVLDIAARLDPQVRVITLDTGRLPDETYRMIDLVRDRYGVQVEVIFPDAGEVGRMVALHGVNLFYREVPLRRLCCHFRKVLPLERALRDVDAIAVGLRRGQSEQRAGVPKIDRGASPAKLSPLADWTRDELEAYQAAHHVPVHPLYAKGYTSIGCAPCTRAVAADEAERAGRWWWETEADKECGLHFSATGQVERKLDVLISEVLSA